MLASTGRAAEHQGGRLGEYVKAGEHGGKPYFLQRDTLGEEDSFLFYTGINWIVGPILGTQNGGLLSNLDTDLPPTDQWKFYDGEVWAVDDHSLTLEHAFLPLACDLVRVEGEEEVVEKQGKSLGDYRSCN